MILYQSNDNGALYLTEHIDDPSDVGCWTMIDVDEPVVLTPAECCGHDGNIVEILLAAGKARKADG